MQMAHNGKQMQVFLFDIADKDSKPIRMTLTMLREKVTGRFTRRFYLRS
jgi:hypothetical protein